MNYIILIGLPGSGKSTVGKNLAKMLDVPFIDTDLLLISEVKKFSNSFNTIQECYVYLGRIKFIELETKILQDLKPSFAVLSTGGGLIKSQENRNTLKKLGTIFYLKTSLDLIEKRLQNQQSRPIFKDGFHETLTKMEEERESLLLEVADYVINGNKSIKDITNDIIDKIRTV